MHTIEQPQRPTPAEAARMALDEAKAAISERDARIKAVLRRGMACATPDCDSACAEYALTIFDGRPRCGHCDCTRCCACGEPTRGAA